MIRTLRYGFVLAVAMLAVVAGTSWGQEGPELLFKPASAPENSDVAHGESGRLRRYVIVDSALLQAPAGDQSATGNAIALELFDGVRHVAYAESIDSPTPNNTIWQGQIEGQPDGTVTLVAHDGVTAGSIWADGRLYRLTYAGDGRHLLEEVADAEPMEEHPPIPVEPLPDELESSQSVSDDDGSVIDVMVVYTPASRARYGGKAGIEALINLAVAETNTAYERSLISTRLALVGTAEVGYNESGSMRDDLYRLQGKGDGYMDQVHTWRDTYAADMVTLIQEASDYCGIAFLMTILSHNFESHSFSVVDSDCATGYYSFGHELGHNMGSAHDHVNAGGSLFAYSFGYWQPEYTFRTIMAYSCPGGCRRIQNFSNPNVLYNGQPTGIAYNNNPSVAADNARSINEARHTVANWRDSATRQPAAPTSLTAAAQSPNQIALNWQDNAVGELGHELQRRIAGQSWATIAYPVANSTNYQDEGLAADTAYEYRIRSYTASMTSDYSNVAGATTPRYPELHIGALNGGGSIQEGYGTANIIWRAVVSVGVHDAYHGAVSGVTVYGQWSGGASGSASCVTDGRGYCSVVKLGLGSGTASVTFSVTGMTNGGDPYVPDHNHDLQGDGTSITLFKPVAANFLPLIGRNP